MSVRNNFGYSTITGRCTWTRDDCAIWFQITRRFRHRHGERAAVTMRDNYLLGDRFDANMMTRARDTRAIQLEHTGQLGPLTWAPTLYNPEGHPCGGAL